MRDRKKHKALEEEYEHYTCKFCMEIGAKEVISEFLEDLKSECLGGKFGMCLYTMDSCKCDSDCANYKLYKKWEAKKNED